MTEEGIFRRPVDRCPRETFRLVDVNVHVSAAGLFTPWILPTLLFARLVPWRLKKPFVKASPVVARAYYEIGDHHA